MTKDVLHTVQKNDMVKWVVSKVTIIWVICLAAVLLGIRFLTPHSRTEQIPFTSSNYKSFEEWSGSIKSNTNTVLFFDASWCPSCRTVDQDIVAHINEIPEGLTILKVDYDKAKDLKQKYTVTTQTTFVLVDAQDNLIKKEIGLLSLADIVKFAQ